MDAQTFLETFKTIAEAPGSVDRLRELVLDLALRGRLTRREPNDGDVDAHLADFAASVQPSQIIEPIGGAESTPWRIPSTWRWVRLKQIVDFAPGKTPSTRDGSLWDEIGQGNLWASIGDMPDSGTLSSTARRISDKAATEVMKRPPASAGALLMSFKLTIGRVCRVGRPTYFNEAIIEIETPREVTKEFLFRTLPLLAQGGASKAAVKGKTLNKRSLTNIAVPFPSLAEQARIVAKIDELFQLCDELEARQEAGQSITTRLRTSSFGALTGAATDDDFHIAWSRIYFNWEALTDQPNCADDLRRAILSLAVSGTLVPSDDVLKTERLVNVTTKIGSGATPKGGRKVYQDAGIPLIRSMNVYFSGFVHAGLVFLSDDRASRLNSVTVQTGDVLLNITGASIGRVTVAPDDMDGARVNQHVSILRPSSALLPGYLALFLASPQTQQLIDEIQVGATRQALTKKTIQQFEMIVPPLSQQLRIVRTVEGLMFRIDELEGKLQASQDIGAELLGTCVNELVTGV